MQLKYKLSIVACAVIVNSAVAEDYISLSIMQYNESDNRVEVTAPAIEVNKDFGTDYSLNVGFVYDAVSGASPTYIDTSSGASAYSRGATTTDNVKKENVSFSEDRMAINAMLTTRFDNRDELKTGINYSSESDYYSLEISGDYMHWLDANHNRSINFGVAVQTNQILAYCKNNSECDTNSGASEKFDSNGVKLNLGFTQVLDSSSMFKGLLLYSMESGYLSNPYLNVVRDYNTTPTVANEKRPDSRSGYGFMAKYLKSFGNVSGNASYKYYSDDWEIKSHTVDSNLYYDLGSFTFGVGLRYYNQSKAKFYSGEKDYFTNETYASSDERLSDFDSMTYRFIVDYKLSKTMSVNVGINYYDQSTGLNASYATTGLKYKF